MSSDLGSDAAVEKPEDIGKGESGFVRRWCMEVELADKEEKDWRKDANKTIQAYRGRELTGGPGDQRTASQKDTFNILWSNVDTMRPALYNSLPRPDIRRKFKDRDPLGKVVSELLERCVTFSIDTNFDKCMIAAVNDYLLPGRAVTRVKYVPHFNTDDIDQEQLAFEEVISEQVQWNDFMIGPGRRWQEVTWIKFDHKLTKTEMEEKFPKFADLVQYDVGIKGEYEESEKTIFKRCHVWEIWDKPTRKVIFIAKSFKTKPLKVQDDPLNLQDFWPIPEPIRPVEDPSSLMPIAEYTQYETLAKELEKITNRIRSIIKGLRLRGIYDSRIGELSSLFDSSDNDMIPAGNVAALLEVGGLDNAIWMFPIATASEVLLRLYEYRQGLLQSIYEITGISDVIRGHTNPNETLGAQELKANFGSQRLKRRQRDIQNYSRDIIRLMVEIIAEKFSQQTIELMSGMSFQTQEQKQVIQQQIALTQGQEIPQNIEEMLKKPAWEDIQRVLHSDILREYKIDIETNSTVQDELQYGKKSMIELLKGITDYFTGVGPLVESGAMPIDTAKQILMSAVRRFDLGTVVEDSLDEIGGGEDQAKNAQVQVQQLQQQIQDEREQVQEQAQDLINQGQNEIKQKTTEIQQEANKQVADIGADAKREADELKASLKIQAEAKELDHQKQLFKMEMENKKAILAMQLKDIPAPATEQSVLSGMDRDNRMKNVIERITKASNAIKLSKTSVVQRDSAGAISGARLN